MRADVFTSAADVGAAIDRLAVTPVLLVATDFDGTIAEIVAHPPDARTLPEAATALETLRDLPATHVTVISGRALDDLRRRPGLPDGLRLVGSHGLEDGAGPLVLTTAERETLEDVRRIASELADSVVGSKVEDKPAGVAFHYRTAEPAAGLAAVRSFAEALAKMPDVTVRSGKAVLEVSVRASSKGRALGRLRAALRATLVCCLGDDETDEEAFAALDGDDVTVRVGPGQTIAHLRLPDPAAAASFLTELATARRAAR